MLVVTPGYVGSVAYARLMRDQMVEPLTAGTALPRDVKAYHSLRAQALEWAVPRRGVLNGLAALWVHGCVPGPAPVHVEVAVPRGVNPDPPAHTGSHQWSIVTEPVAVLSALGVGGVLVASPATACVAALRRDDHTLTIPAIFSAIQRGLCNASDVAAVVRTHSRRGRGYDRMMSAWREIRIALTAP